jgi:restriction system protein
LRALVPGVSRRHQGEIDGAKHSYQRVLEHWEQDEAARQSILADARLEHDMKIAAFEAKKQQRNSEVDEFEAAYRSGDADSIVAYCSMVLERSAYPEGFPSTRSVAYVKDSRQLVVECELPGIASIPGVEEHKYSKTKDEITAKARKEADVKRLYQDLIASIALRTIHEVFESDQANNIDVCCFNGFVSTVDLATGHDIQPHLISVRTTKERFAPIDLARVDKGVCLKNLGAQVSRHPTEAQPVRPIIEFDMADARFVDQNDMVSSLDSSANLMELNPHQFEHLVANLFGQMGLESKLTRSSRDGGVDCVAYDPRPVLGGKVVIQAKRYRHTVGVAAVRDLYGTMMNEGANKGILVATSGYGPDAFDFAKDKPIELIDGGGLLFLLQEVGVAARIVMPTED